MMKKTFVIAIAFVFLAVLAGCAASENALKAVSVKAKELQQKVAGAFSEEDPQATASQEESTVSSSQKAETKTIKESAPKEPSAKKSPSTETPAPVKKKTVSPGYTCCKTPRDSFYQAYLSPEWNNSSFKYVSIDGLRYSRGIILNHVNDPNNDSIFFKKEGGGLCVELKEHFDLEIAFYSPDEKGHEVFKPFQVIVVNRKNEVAESQEITSRMKKYTISR